MTTQYLSSNNFPSASSAATDILAAELDTLLSSDFTGNMFTLLAGYQRILADNRQRHQWTSVHKKLETLFKCGSYAMVDGPMIGIPLSIRDSDYFKDTAHHFGKDRSAIAGLEWMATAWNLTFTDTGLWMGKTFEPVSREVVADKTGGDAAMLADYNPQTARIGRNYFREPRRPNLIQSLGLPALTPLWNLKPRPGSTAEKLFDGELLAENLAKEVNIPYSRTGGIFLAFPGKSVVPEMRGKDVYQLNYRWPRLDSAYPMSRLIDELVRIADGIYLGQLVFATKHYSLGNLHLPGNSALPGIPIGEAYTGQLGKPLDFFSKLVSGGKKVDYGYQNNGYFLMMDPAYAKEVYADNAFPQLRPTAGESGYCELGYDKIAPVSRVTVPTASLAQGPGVTDWVHGWRDDEGLREKFTTFILEESPKRSDGDVRELLREGESILQMLQRISGEISAQTAADDRLKHFENLHRLFRCGIAPRVVNGLFQGHGKKGYNCRANGKERRDWYGQADVAHGFDFYHGATLNLHLGLSDTLQGDINQIVHDSQLFPSILGTILDDELPKTPNVLNVVWHSIGKYIFPWAGKSFEKINGRKLSMFLDESSDLASRYPERVRELRSHLASAPHYALVKKASHHYRPQPGAYAAHLQSGSWDQGMSSEDKAFWEKEANDHWVDGNNIQDERIVAADPLMRVIDMNYRVPDPSLQAISEAGPSPFARQGYIFLGVDDRESILPMNSEGDNRKKVFQFHYRYPMIGGPAPIGLCLDELVEIADGLFLGQLIYATAIGVPYHSSVDPAEFKYQLFGYFLLMDDTWERHRRAIKLDVWQEDQR